MNRLVFPLIVLSVALVYTATFTVAQNQTAIKLSAGDEVLRSDYQPGLQFMLPLLNHVRKFDKRVITHEFSDSQFVTSDDRALRVEFYIQWQLNDVASYYHATSGDEALVVQQLGDIVNNGFKSAVAQHTLQQVVAADSADLMSELLVAAKAKSTALGLQLIDVRIRKINLPDAISEYEYNLLRQKFVLQAVQLRAEGESAEQELRAKAERERTEILANADRDASITRGEGDAKAAAISASAYGRNAEFYTFYRSMQAYRESLGKPGDILVISPDSDFFKYFNKSAAR